MISIIVPNLNEEKNLPRFLSSLENQSLQNFEVIIIDGYSNDKSWDIIRSFKGRINIKIILSKIKNFGYLRNLGHKYARGGIIIQSNSDCYFPPDFLERLYLYYWEHPTVLSVTGRVVPMGTSFTAKLAYPAFDLLRFIAASLPSSVQKYRPSGSFISYRCFVFDVIGGFPEVTVNEDGLFGQRIDEVCRVKGRKSVVFLFRLWVGHHVKKFEDWGGIRALLFYLYVLRNHFPMLNFFLKPVENRAGAVFSGN